MNVSELVKWAKRERWVGEGLVGRFKLDLDEEGVRIKEAGENSFHAEREGIGINVSVHEHTPRAPGTEDKGWWGVQHSFVEKGEVSGLPWGVVFLHGPIKCGFWVAGLDFFKVVKGSPDSQGKYHIHLRQLEEVPGMAKRFCTIGEFLRVSGLEEA